MNRRGKQSLNEPLFHREPHYRRNIDITSGEIIAVIAFSRPARLTFPPSHNTLLNMPAARTNLFFCKFVELRTFCILLNESLSYITRRCVLHSRNEYYRRQADLMLYTLYERFQCLEHHVSTLISHGRNRMQI